MNRSAWVSAVLWFCLSLRPTAKNGLIYFKYKAQYYSSGACASHCRFSCYRPILFIFGNYLRSTIFSALTLFIRQQKHPGIMVGVVVLYNQLNHRLESSQNLILKVGRLSVWPVLLSTDFSQHPVPTHPSPQRITLLRWGDGWMGTGCWYSGLPYGSCSMQHASQQSATYDPIINYSSNRQGSATWCDAATCGRLCRYR